MVVIGKSMGGGYRNQCPQLPAGVEKVGFIFR